MPMKLMPVTIYTIVKSERLHKMYRAGIAKFEEGARWVAAAKLLRQAKATGRSLPIVFAPAEEIWELIYRGTINSISPIVDPKGKRTRIVVTDLKPFRGNRPNKTDLVVISTGRPIPEGDIRPYRLCRTPDFLKR
jgi:hypothetical protein